MLFTMNWKIITVFTVNWIFADSSAELYEHHDYLEEHHHVLFGLGTPIFVAKLNFTGQNDTKPEIIYDRAYYPKPGEKIKYTRDMKKESIGKPDGYYSYQTVPSNDDSTTPENPSNRRGKSLANTVYPEIFVVVDYKTYEAHNKDLVELATYMAAFWNGVDLRFRQMKDPQIRLNIAGIVVASDPEVEPYLERDSTTSTRLVLDATSEYFHKRFSGYYDVLVTFLHRSEASDEKIKDYSFHQGVCRNKYSSILIQDAGGFEGIITATRSLGRLFGSPNDDDISEKNFGGCKASDGYMMSHLWGTENKMHWSKCSVRAMQSFLSTANCLKDKPDVIIPYLKKLPGKLLTRDEQCEKIFPGLRSVAEENCVVLKCAISSWFTHIEGNDSTPPAEGSSCGEKNFCLDGKCVADPGVHD